MPTPEEIREGRMEALLSRDAVIDRLRAALLEVMTGGNHIASQLVNRLGPEFSEKYPPYTPADTVLRGLCETVDYDMWCCWAAIMRARDALNK